MNGETPCVLVVDDEENIVYAISRFLERKGCRVLAAGDADSALEAVREVEPAVALLDIVLPGMNGLRLAAEIKLRWPDCEMVMITGQSSVDSAVEAIHQGALDYLSKPFESLEILWTATLRALDKRAESKGKKAILDRLERLEAELRTTMEAPSGTR